MGSWLSGRGGHDSDGCESPSHIVSIRLCNKVSDHIHDSADGIVEAGTSLGDTDLHSFTILRVGIHVNCII